METTTSRSNGSASGAVDSGAVDLTLVGKACRDLVDWYDTQVAGEQPTVGDLQRIMMKLRALPPMPGLMGCDVDLIASGGLSRPRDEVIGEIERLRRVAAEREG